MEWLSPYILAGLAGYVVAQLTKYVIATAQGKRFVSLRKFYASGGMPSSHAATVIAITTVIGFRDGTGSGLFGLAVVLSSVVLYDAVMVRRSSGEQGESLTALIKEQKSRVRLPRVAIGHKPLEVVMGALLGWVVGLIILMLY